MAASTRQIIKQAQKLAAAGKIVEAINTYESALQTSPNNPDILFAIGNLALKSGMLQIAEQMFRLTCQLRPDSIEAATQLAIALKEQERVDEAIDIYQSILEAHPEHTATWINIGVAANLAGDTESAEIAYRQALSLDPRCVAALTNLAELLTRSDNFDQALELLDQARALAPNDANIRYNRGEVLLTLGRLTEGWPELNYGERHRPDRQQVFKHKLPRWRGEPLQGKSILLSCEQGIGDQVRFLNCVAPIIRQAQSVVIETDPRLVPALSRTYPEAKVRAFNVVKQNNRHIFRYDWPVNQLDYSSTMLNLFEQLCPDLGNLPEQRKLQIDPSLDKKWLQRTAPQPGQLNVGLCWRSSIKSLRRQQQYAAIEEWEPVFRQPGLRFFSLMYDDCREEVARAKEKFGVEIILFDDLDYHDDIEQVLALTAQMDVVVATHSAAASFAGALEIPTWMPVKNRLWDMLGTDTMAMVPSIHPVLQGAADNWEEIMEYISRQLAKPSH